MTSRTKSGLMETPRNKSKPATPRASKLGRTPSKLESNSHSPLQNSRLSLDRLPGSIDSKPSIERRSLLKISGASTATSEPQAENGSELQAELNAAWEDLRKAKERLTSTEKEKAQAAEELKEAKTELAEANAKLAQALAAKQKAEDSTEFEKFRAIELEQAGIEAAQQREEIWERELENVRNQHAIDVAALLSTTQELQRVRHELAMVTEAKNTALSHADDAMKIAEINAEKVGILSGEINRLKGLLDHKVDSKTNEAMNQVRKLGSEVESLNSQVESLKCELQRAKEAQKRLIEMENLIEGLRIEVTDAKRAESAAGNLVDEWKKKADLLEAKVDEAIRSEKSASESLVMAVKRLEERDESLQLAESEITCLKGMVESLEMEIARHKGNLDESNSLLQNAKLQAQGFEETVEDLKSDLRAMEEERMKILDNERQVALKLQNLVEEKNKLLSELESSRDELELTKRAMEGLASALHEVSTKGRESQERLSAKQVEVANANKQIDELMVALGTLEVKYDIMINQSKEEVSRLKTIVERSETEMENSKAEWSATELTFMNRIKRSEEEATGIKEELDKMVSKLKVLEMEFTVAKEEEHQLHNRLKEAELQASSSKVVAEEASVEILQLKERLLDNENELQNIMQENCDLRTREEAALEKVKELSGLLEEAMTKKDEENEQLSNSEKDYDVISKIAEFPDDNVNECKTHVDNSKVMEKQKVLVQEDPTLKEMNGHRHVEEKEAMEMEAMFLESSKGVEKGNMEAPLLETSDVVEKGVSPEREPEPELLVNDEVESKIDNETANQTNGLPPEASPLSNEMQQKKKKPLLHKFGSLLKKKNNQR